MEGEAGFEPAIVGLQPIAFASWLLALMFLAHRRGVEPRASGFGDLTGRRTPVRGRSGVIRTLTEPGLSRMPLPLGYAPKKWWAGQDLNLRCSP